MLNQDELSNLYNTISDDSKTFENLASSFQKLFPKSDQFKVGVTLWYLIKDNLLNLSQRLSSFYIFYDMYKNESVSTTPFVPIILETLQSSNNNIERKFLLEFVSMGIVKHAKMTIKSFIEENTNIDTVTVPDLKQYWQIHNTEREKFSNIINDWVRPVIYEQDDSTNTLKENQVPFNLSKLTKEEISFNYFEPNYMTLHPNTSYPFYEDEPLWIMPGLNYDFLWDFSLSPEQNTSKYFNL